MSFDWTEERVARLKELWADKRLSASMIGVELGGASRNSVVGKAHRLCLPSRGDRSRPQTNSRGILAAIKKKKAAPVKPNKPAPFVGGFAALRQGPSALQGGAGRTDNDHIDLPTGQGKCLLDFDDHPASARYCRWPLNSPARGSEYFFCGALTLRGCVYCGAHAERAGAGYGRAA